MKTNYTQNDIDRFWKKINPSKTTDECWIWEAAKNSQGYGMIRVGSKMIRAHRMSYTIAYGDIPAQLKVLHRCDNPSCVNPNHLFLGTTADNHEDMDKKGRRKNPVGEQHGNHKLTHDQVSEIRKRYIRHSKDNNIMVLAKEFNVSFQLISDIINNLIWVKG